MISEAAKEIEEEIVTLNPIVKTLEQFEPLLAFFEVRSSFVLLKIRNVFLAIDSDCSFVSSYDSSHA